MDKFYESDCGQRYPADVLLAEQVFNGGYESTHFFLNRYANAAAQQKAAEILRTCPAALAFLTEMKEAGVVVTMEHLSLPLIAEGDYTQYTALAKFDASRAPESIGLCNGTGKMMNAGAGDIDVRSYGNNLATFGNDRFELGIRGRRIAHAVGIYSASPLRPAYAAFQETADIRESVNATQVLFVKSYPMLNVDIFRISARSSEGHYGPVILQRHDLDTLPSSLIWNTSRYPPALFSGQYHLATQR